VLSKTKLPAVKGNVYRPDMSTQMTKSISMSSATFLTLLTFHSLQKMVYLMHIWQNIFG